MVNYYIEQSKANNHAVREAACACIAELMCKVGARHWEMLLLLLLLLDRAKALPCGMLHHCCTLHHGSLLPCTASHAPGLGREDTTQAQSDERHLISLVMPDREHNPTPSLPTCPCRLPACLHPRTAAPPSLLLPHALAWL